MSSAYRAGSLARLTARAPTPRPKVSRTAPLFRIVPLRRNKLRLITFRTPRLFFEPCDLLDPACMPACLKLGFQPNFNHAVKEFSAQQVGRKAQDIGIVMPAAHLGRDAVVARRCPHPR